MLYAAGFCSRSVYLFQHKKTSYVVMSDLEIDRAKNSPTWIECCPFAVPEKVAQAGNGQPGDDRCSRSALSRTEASAPYRSSDFPRCWRPAERQRVYRANQTGSFFARERKAADEVRHITESLRVAKLGLEAGIRALKRTKIGRDGYLYLNGSRLTSETLKTAVNTTIMAQGWLPSHTIISSGNQCVDPHHEGTGPIKAHTSIIFDIFPRSQKNGYSAT